MSSQNISSSPAGHLLSPSVPPSSAHPNPPFSNDSKRSKSPEPPLFERNAHHHQHLPLADSTSLTTVSLDSAQTLARGGAKMMLLDIACGSISGLVNHCVGHPIE